MQKITGKSPEQKAWEAEKVKLFNATQPYNEFERLLAEAEEEKKLLFGDD